MLTTNNTLTMTGAQNVTSKLLNAKTSMVQHQQYQIQYMMQIVYVLLVKVQHLIEKLLYWIMCKLMIIY
jgi:hypothetical protein